MSNSTPPPVNESQGTELTQRRNRTQMIVILLVAFVTLGGSYVMFYTAKNSGGWGTTNNGTFVEPATNIEQFGWQVPGDLHHWWLWTVAQDCRLQCETSAQQMRALHILLNRDAERVRRGRRFACHVDVDASRSFEPPRHDLAELVVSAAIQRQFLSLCGTSRRHQCKRRCAKRIFE